MQMFFTCMLGLSMIYAHGTLFKKADLGVLALFEINHDMVLNFIFHDLWHVNMKVMLDIVANLIIFIHYISDSCLLSY